VASPESGQTVRDDHAIAARSISEYVGESIPPTHGLGATLRPVGSIPTSHASRHSTRRRSCLLVRLRRAIPQQFAIFALNLARLSGAIPIPQLAVQSKAQELPLPSPPRPAFSGIHLQAQMLLNPVLYRGERPVRRRLTAYVDICSHRRSGNTNAPA